MSDDADEARHAEEVRAQRHRDRVALGTARATREFGPPPAPKPKPEKWGPFRFTPSERRRIAARLDCYKHTKLGVVEALDEIEAIIAEEVDQQC